MLKEGPFTHLRPNILITVVWFSDSPNYNILKVKVNVLVAQSCLTLCDSMDYSLLGSSIHGIFQARILEWVAISFSRRSSWPRDWTLVCCVSCIVGRHFTIWATREVLTNTEQNKTWNLWPSTDHTLSPQYCRASLEWQEVRWWPSSARDRKCHL